MGAAQFFLPEVDLEDRLQLLAVPAESAQELLVVRPPKRVVGGLTLRF